ncbi:MAG: ABC transporter ATP-binding protein [Firmicutes bacterium]|nr:ABC transporter ATP-binding protein [Bacillota bacterium]
MENIIEVKNLTKKYKNLKAVDDLSFEVKKGEILGLLGPNGSGKSTTINCLLSLLNYQNGSIKIFGEEMTPTSYEIKKQIGVIFQEIAVFEELTVYENIDYFCGLYISDKSLRKSYVMDAIKLVGIEDFINFYPKQLSGGLKRRLNIACGIAHKPKLIFLDEPTVAVDPQSRNNILDGIKKLRNDGATILYTTHYMEEVELICDRIIILDKGRIIASGTSDELKKLANIEEKITVEVTNMSSSILENIKKFKTVDSVTYDRNVLSIIYRKGKNNLEELMDYLKENKVSYNKIFSERPTLNDVFLELTGKGLRDAI